MPPPEKPAYLGQLNAICLAESSAGVYLRAWADATDDDDLACTLRLVAAREASHGEVFRRRLSELGFNVKPKHDPAAEYRLAKLANPKIADCEKLPSRSEDAEDPFADIRTKLTEGAYDPMTANLLKWYVTEEDDSGRRLREAYECVREKAKGQAKTNGHVAHLSSVPVADAEAIMACITAGFSRLEKSLEKLAKAVK